MLNNKAINFQLDTAVTHAPTAQPEKGVSARYTKAIKEIIQVHTN